MKNAKCFFRRFFSSLNGARFSGEKWSFSCYFWTFGGWKHVSAKLNAATASANQTPNEIRKIAHFVDPNVQHRHGRAWGWDTASYIIWYWYTFCLDFNGAGVETTVSACTATVFRLKASGSETKMKCVVNEYKWLSGGMHATCVALYWHSKRKWINDGLVCYFEFFCELFVH